MSERGLGSKTGLRRLCHKLRDEYAVGWWSVATWREPSLRADPECDALVRRINDQYHFSEDEASKFNRQVILLNDPAQARSHYVWWMLRCDDKQLGKLCKDGRWP